MSGVEVRNGNGSHKTSNNNNNLCDSDIVDIYEQNQNGSNHLEIGGSSSTMVLSTQSNNFYASERFKVLLGKYSAWKDGSVVFIQNKIASVCVELIYSFFLFFFLRNTDSEATLPAPHKLVCLLDACYACIEQKNALACEGPVR